MKNEIVVQEHIENKLRFYYLRNYRWILHSLYWLYAFIHGQLIIKEPLLSVQGFFYNFLFDNWLIIAFYYIYALYLIPQLFKKNKKKAFWIGFAIIFITLPVLNIAFQIIFEPYIPAVYADHHFQWANFPQHLLFYLYIYLWNFISFTGFLFLMETAESLSNFKAIAAAKDDVTQTQKQFLKTRLDPAFIMNTLDHITTMAQQKHSQTAQTIVQFSDILRYRLYRSKIDDIELSEELLQIKHTFDLYNTAYQKAYILEVEGNTECIRVHPSSLLGMLAQILDTGAADQNDNIVFYLLALEQEIDLAIEWESDYTDKKSITRNIVTHLEEFYPGRFRMEYDLTDRLCSIRIHLNLHPAKSL